MSPRAKAILSGGALLTAASLLMIPAASFYYETGGGKRCASCHEMTALYNRWHASSHRGVGCEKCHGGALTTDVSFHWNNARRAYSHWRGDLAEQIGLGNRYVEETTARCASCHRQEFADWQAGPHAATYQRIFADEKHNSREMLMDDCLRCHGMFFEGGVAEVVAPVSRTGPWRILPAGLAQQPTMPCLGCHAIHREGEPLRNARGQDRAPGAAQEIYRPSLALFDRRTREAVPVSQLSIPAIWEGSRPVRMSPDQRQALCYQCHAPIASMQVGSGDDRTAIGVHEGISCLGCHLKHSQGTRASCATCHPRMSNCGLDVEKMETTFRSKDSRHNIHWVKCADCHPRGVPKRRARPGISFSSGE